MDKQAKQVVLQLNIGSYTVLMTALRLYSFEEEEKVIADQLSGLVEVQYTGKT